MARAFTEFQKEAAFDTYYAMGAKRDLKELIRNLEGTEEFPDKQPTYSTIKKWSMANNWQERCKQRDIENSKPRQAKTDKEVVKTKADYRAEIGKDLKDIDAIGSRIIKLLADVAQKLESEGKTEDGKDKPPAIEIKTIEELDKMVGSLKKYRDIKKDLVKLDLELIGESEGLRDVSINISEAIMNESYYRET